MQRPVLSAIILLSLLIAMPGCERSAPKPPEPPSPPPAPAASTTSETATPAVASEMVLLKGGSFQMGDPDEIDAPVHEVSLNPFSIDTHLITQALYERLMNSNPSRWKIDGNPVEQVRWSDAVRFCNKRSEAEGLQPCYNLETWSCDFEANGYRLPTEAEWEYACRAGTTTPYFFGSTAAKLGDYAWFERNSDGHPQPVGRKKPNPWGLHDICGNVWEWCNDFYQVDYYEKSPKSDPKGPAEGETKVVRGGAWRFSDDSCRSGYRYNESPGYADVCFGYDIYGFRCVRNASTN